MPSGLATKISPRRYYLIVAETPVNSRATLGFFGSEKSMMRIVCGRRRGPGSGTLTADQGSGARHHGQVARSAMGSIGNVGKHGRLIRLRHVDQCDVPTSLVFGVEIVAAVMLSGLEAPHRSTGQGNMSHHLNFVFRRGLGLLVPGAHGRSQGCRYGQKHNRG